MRLYLATKKEEGYVFLSIAIGITVILALLTVFLANSASVRVTVTADFIETTQSYYNAISGIEYAIERMKIDIPSAVGTFEHANGTVQIDTSTFDYYGNPLTCRRRRFISTGRHGQTERLVEIIVEYKVVSSNPPWGPISVVEVSSAEFTIGSEFALNDSIFIGKSVEVGHVILRPDGAGDKNTWDSGTYSDVNDQSDATYLESSGGPLPPLQEGLFSAENHSAGSGTINWVRVNIRYKDDATALIHVKVRTSMKTNGTEYDGAEVTCSASWSDTYTEYATNPSTGSDWTWDEIDNIQIGADGQGAGTSLLPVNAQIAEIWLEVEETVNIGDPPGNPTCIYVPEGHTVTGPFDEYFTWSKHPEPVPALPDFDHTFYDSLISIANSITSTSGNKYRGNLTIEGDFDLSLCENSMYFVNGNVKITGGYITGGDYSGKPGILISSDKITCSEYKPTGQESIIDDNIIFITGSGLEFDDASKFGEDWSYKSPLERPATFNEVYAKDIVEIMDDAVVWALCTSMSDLVLDGKLYGVAYAPATRVDFNKSTSFLEGALFTKQLNKKDIVEYGVMNLHHIYPVQFSTQYWQYKVVGNTWREI